PPRRRAWARSRADRPHAGDGTRRGRRRGDRLLRREIPLPVLAPLPGDPTSRHRQQPGYRRRPNLETARSTLQCGPRTNLPQQPPTTPHPDPPPPARGCSPPTTIPPPHTPPPPPPPPAPQNHPATTRASATPSRTSLRLASWWASTSSARTW